MVERETIGFDLSIGDFRADGRPTDADEDSTCICGKECLASTEDQPEDMLDCDTCHKWFHLKCFGITNAAVLRTWKCDTCLVRSATSAIMERLRIRQQTAAAKAKLAAAEAQQQREDAQKRDASKAKAKNPARAKGASKSKSKRAARPRKAKTLALQNLDSDEDEDDGKLSLIHI